MFVGLACHFSDNFIVPKFSNCEHTVKIDIFDQVYGGNLIYLCIFLFAVILLLQNDNFFRRSFCLKSYEKELIFLYDKNEANLFYDKQFGLNIDRCMCTLLCFKIPI